MNYSQKMALAIGLAIASLVALVPPWANSENTQGYWLLEPPGPPASTGACSRPGLV